MSNNNIGKVVKILKNSKNLIIAAGAGIGVDSGLPDFRSKEGFWKAYPPYKKLGLSFYEAANPAIFIDNPKFGWGFYGHRLNLYRKTKPHKGFYYLQEWIEKFSLNYFIITSNVDGQFQKSGFNDEHIYEVHGSIHYLQCLTPCCNKIWKNNLEFNINESTMCSNFLPTCPYCGGYARPNILMFGDVGWISGRSDMQENYFYNWLNNLLNNTIILEIGAGTAVPTIRHFTSKLANLTNGIIVRINPNEYTIEEPNISLPLRALEALELINKGIVV
jgi:NAD-dependent SIR2 family protein deacetylase